MTDPDPAAIAQNIDELEQQIEALSEVALRCRKALVFARVTIISGFLALLGATFGLFSSGAVGFLLAVAALLGGVVFFGSTRSTLLEVLGRLQSLEARRLTLIDQAPMRTIANDDSGN
jgi:hypothetical protein